MNHSAKVKRAVKELETVKFYWAMLYILETGDIFHKGSDLTKLSQIAFKGPEPIPLPGNAIIVQAFYNKRPLLDQELKILNSNHDFIQRLILKLVADYLDSPT